MNPRIPAFLLVLTSCTVGPDYQKPATPAPESFAATAGPRVDTGAADLRRWWQSFGDTELDQLIERAIASNHDLRIAASRVREARAQLGIARGALLPAVDAGSSSTRERLSENGEFPGDGHSHGLHRVGFDAAWELDVFGGNRRAIEAAGAELDAILEDRRAVLVTLLGEVASAYIELRGNQRLAAVQRRNTEAARTTLELTRVRLRAQLSTTLDVARAEAQLASTEALVPEAERGARLAVHRLGILLGREPAALAQELEQPGTIPAPPSRIATGLPSELLTRRPDLRRAERQLAAATARIGVATAELYPRFSILGSLGFESVDLKDLVGAASRTWSVGSSMQWSVFRGGSLRAQVEAAGAQAEQALLAYEQSFLLGLEEVENAVIAYAREWEKRQSLDTAARASDTAVVLADDLHQKGLASFLEVLESQRTAYEAQRQLVQSEAAVSLQAVALYKGLGGGWEAFN